MKQVMMALAVTALCWGTAGCDKDKAQGKKVVKGGGAAAEEAPAGDEAEDDEPADDEADGKAKKKAEPPKKPAPAPKPTKSESGDDEEGADDPVAGGAEAAAKTADKVDDDGGDEESPGAEGMAATIIAAMDAFSAGKLDEAAAPFGAEATWVRYGDPRRPKGPAELKAAMAQTRVAFPDAAMKASRVWEVADDTIVVEAIFTGTHKGELSMPGGKKAPATDKAVGISTLHVFGHSGGKITSWIEYVDPMSILQQVGLVPVREPGKMPPVVKPPAETVMIAGEPNQQLVEGAKKALTMKAADMAGMLAEGFKAHGPTGQSLDGEAMMGMYAAYEKGFPDAKATHEGVWAMGDWLIERTNWKGTHTGEFMGMKPTNKPIDTHHVNVARFKDGKLAETWAWYSRLEMMGQLGVTGGPKPAPGKGK